MKLALSLITLLGAFSVQAAEIACNSQLSSVLANVQACRVGNNLAACESACSALSGSAIGCSATEIQLARNDERARTLEAVRMDMNAEGKILVVAFGYDAEHCMINAETRGQTLMGEAISQCQSQLRSGLFQFCAPSNTRIVESPVLVAPINGDGHIQEKEASLGGSTEAAAAEGARRAQAEAQQKAMRNCQSATGAGCHITSTTAAICKQEEHRSLGIIGRKEKYQDCTASAQAMPDANSAFRCAIEIRAKVRF
jgi:hypothetical protein